LSACGALVSLYLYLFGRVLFVFLDSLLSLRFSLALNFSVCARFSLDLRAFLVPVWLWVCDCTAILSSTEPLPVPILSFGCTFEDDSTAALRIYPPSRGPVLRLHTRRPFLRCKLAPFPVSPFFSGVFSGYRYPAVFWRIYPPFSIVGPEFVHLCPPTLAWFSTPHSFCLHSYSFCPQTFATAPFYVLTLMLTLCCSQLR